MVNNDFVEKTPELPAAFLYLLPWALAYSEDILYLKRVCLVIDLPIIAYANFSLFKDLNRQAVTQHRKILDRFARYPIEI